PAAPVADFLTAVFTLAVPAAGRTGTRRKPPAWDPIAPPSRKPPRARHISVPPWDLPEPMQATLRRMAMGMPQNGVAVSTEILKRMREKLCQFVWSARQAGLPPTLCDTAVERYIGDLMARGEAREHGIRWATVRASVEELHRY